jgi:CheY-like chemotaxis protein
MVSQSPQSAPHERCRPLRVFVVEDHQDTRDVLCLLLGMLGHEVLTARSMQEALLRIPSAHCDVLLTDIGLPDGSGWDLLGLLGDSSPHYSLAMSGYGMNSDVEKSQSAGFRHHLVKPLGPERLNEYLEEAAREVAVSP